MIRALLPAFAALAVTAPVATSTGAPPKILFEDQFTGSRLKPGRWQSGAERFPGFPHVETRFGNGESQQYVPEQVKVAKGQLRILARPMKPAERAMWVRRLADPKFAYKGGMLEALTAVNWVSGQISTYPATPFAPGTKLSARIMLPVGAQSWPGVWAFDYANVTEVDLFEGSGRAGDDPMGNLSQGVHDFKSNYHKGCDKAAVPTAGWHVVTADWTDPTKLVFGYDDKIHCTVAAGPRMTKPMSVIINMAVGSSKWPWIGKPDAKTPNPLHFVVDWVRVER
jgi:hypothetical protein